jgi:hypothetical protein
VQARKDMLLEHETKRGPHAARISSPKVQREMAKKQSLQAVREVADVVVAKVGATIEPTRLGNILTRLRHSSSAAGEDTLKKVKQSALNEATNPTKITKISL